MNRCYCQYYPLSEVIRGLIYGLPLARVSGAEFVVKGEPPPLRISFVVRLTNDSFKSDRSGPAIHRGLSQNAENLLRERFRIFRLPK